MQVTELKNEGLKREFEVTLKAKDINKRVEERLAKVAKTIKVAGFRPGKVPLSLVKKKHGKEILGEVLEHAVADSSHKVLTERDLNPAMQPKIEISSFDPEKENSDLVYSLSFEIYPNVPDVDLAKIAVEKSVIEVTEKEVNDGLERLKSMQKDFQPLKKARATKTGDSVVIDFVGKTDGKPFEGGAANDFQLELGSGQFIPGFEEQLVGSKKDDKVVVKVKFPDQYGSADLAGKDAEFDVTIKDILAAVEPELNDEFAAKVGMENLDKLKDAIKEQIAHDFEYIARTKLKKDIFDALDAGYKFDVPESMVSMEFESIKESSKSAEEVQKADEKELQKFNDEFKVLAERRVRLGVILADIGKKNAIKVNEDELRKSVFEQARNYPGQEHKVIEFYQKNRDALDKLRGPLLEEKVVDFVLSKVKCSEKKVTTEDLLKFNNEDAV